MQKLLLLLLANSVTPCSMAPGFVFSTIDEEVDFAGGIVIGTVMSVTNQFDADVVLNNLTFLRGCLTA